MRTQAEALIRWFETCARDLPWRRTVEPYAVWVSEIMLQQTQVNTVIPYWERWMKVLPTVQALARADSQRLHKLWEGLGYYTRVRNMQHAARLVMTRHQGVLPSSFEAWHALPGIGRYTAGAICSIAFNQPTPVLDGNVIRVLTRLFGLEGNPREKETNTKLWLISEGLVCEAAKLPFERGCSSLNQALMELGAMVCRPRDPDCGRCPLAKACTARRTNRALEFPQLPKRAALTRRRYRAFVVAKNQKYLVRQRAQGQVNESLWEFPVGEVNGEASVLATAKTVLGIQPEGLELLLRLVHSITRYRNELEVYRADVKRLKQNGRWLPLAQLEKLPFPSAHKRILAALRARQGRGGLALPEC